jgi:membrane-associated phospholipid phosphatase
MKQKIATYISIIGHPLLTIPLFIIITLFSQESFERAVWISVLFIAGIFIPLAIKMYRNTKKGTYTNFDVSDKSQRQYWYLFAILLLVIVTVILFVTDQPSTIRWGTLSALLLLIASTLLNYAIKSSLHVSYNILLAFFAMPMSVVSGMIILLLIIPIAWSRYTLKLHTLKELLSGAVLGLCAGLVFLWKLNLIP